MSDHRRQPWDGGRGESHARHEVDEEIRFHLESRVRDLVAEGASEEEAWARARAEFGDVERARRSLAGQASRHRALRRLAAGAADALTDVRFALRGLRRSPSFAVVSVATLGLAIGVAVSIFAAVNAVLLRPLPYAEPDRLVMLWESHPERTERSIVSRANFLRWRERAASFEEMAAYRLDFGVALTGDGEPEQTMVSWVTANLFGMLGVPPALGRGLDPSDDEPGAERVVVMSHALWRTRFGGDPDVVGRTVLLDDAATTIVGVMPPDVRIPSRQTDFWLPMQLGPAERDQWESHVLYVIGRLAPGVALGAASAEMQALAREHERLAPVDMAGWSVNPVPLQADWVRPVRTPLLVLQVAVIVLLMIACANVGHLLLARAVGRETELAVRGALGAGRVRVLRQLVTESAVLAALGALAGVAIAFPAIRMLAALAPPDLPLIDRARVDGSVVLFAVAATVASVLAFGVLPAGRASRVPPQRSLRGAGGTPRHGRLRSALLAAEVALSVALVATAGLLVRSFRALDRVDHGFHAENLLLVQLNLPFSRYGDSEAHVALYDELLERVAALPGVAEVAGSSEPPVIGYNMTRTFVVEGRPDAFAGGRDDHPYRAVTSGFFKAAAVQGMAGRTFGPTDRRGAPPVVVVNRAMADLAWPGEDPVGKRMAFDAQDAPWMEVVGVVADTRMVAPELPDVPAVYAPYAQKDWEWLSWMTLFVQSEGPPLALAESLREAIWAVDPDLPLQRVTTLDDVYAEGLARHRFVTLLLLAFAAASMALGAIGTYGVAAYGVAARTREVGIRVALGAGRARVVRSLLGSTLAAVGAGAALGVALALGAGRLLGGLLYEVGAADPVSLIGAAALLVAAAAVAVATPAVRALRMRASEAIRGGG